MVEYTIDLAGRVKNFGLPKQQPLIPLYEAIVNSLYAIEERQEKEDFHEYINIEIVRENQEIANLEGVNSSINEIMGFNIIDNGIGLDDNNMRSFLRSDSTYREAKGGKGVGRFSWLKAFEKAEVESIFKDVDETYVKRQFQFSVEKKEIDDRLVAVSGYKDNYTKVELINYKFDYRKNVTKDAEKIAIKIMQHCLISLMSLKCPQITLVDDIKYNINDMFRQRVKREENSEEIEILGKKFDLLNVQFEDSTLRGNKLYLCANDRVVKEIELNKEIVDLDNKIYEAKGFYYVGVLTSEYLDKNVDMTRTSFDIAEKSNGEEVSMENIIDAVKIKVELFLAEYLNQVKQQKDERIKKYISHNAPQFTHLLKYMSESVKEIKPGLTDDKLDEELYRIKRKFDLKLKDENIQIIKALDVGAENLEAYKDKFQTQFEKISEANKAALAEYVAHRKIILELLKKGIRLKEDGKFDKEAYIHNLVYPMRRTSEEIEYKSHNLWLIDERLAYCDYVSSDIPFNNDNREERTDILILDNPVAVSDANNDGREYESIVIFELKRPMRNDYNTADNPIQQMLNYVDKLNSNRMTDKEGRLIKVGDTTQFYLYAVCDITSNLKKVAEDHDFIETPDKLGFYKYHDKKRAYIEVISYDKLINDAEKRNRILFDKLGIV